MINYKFPTSLEELTPGDIYEIKYPIGDEWTDRKTYYNNECESCKQTLNNLIKQNRVRIMNV